MTSVTYDFFVGPPDPETKKITFKPAEFRFTTKPARLLELAAGVGIEWLVARGQNVHTMVLLVHHGLMWNPKLKMTEDKAIALIDEFVDAGGDVAEVTKAMFKALNDSGVYGKPKEKEEGGDDEKKQEKKQDGDAPLP